MSLLNSLLQNADLGAMARNALSDPRVIGAVTSFLSPDDDDVGPRNGGLGGVLDSLRSAGQGEAVDSWVGAGRNQEIRPDQLEQALGQDTLRQFAERAQVPEKESAGMLANLLPALVDGLTSNNQVPQGGALGGLLKQLMR